MADIRRLVGDVLPRANGDPNIALVADEPAESNGSTQIAPLQEPGVKGVFDGVEPRVVHNDDGAAEVTAGNAPTPGGPAEASIRIDRDRSGASAEMVLLNGHRAESRRTSPDGRT